MRCPKCGFISFDLVETCGKCGKNISEEMGLPPGTTTPIEPPRFLRLDAVKAEPEAPAGVEGEMEFEMEEAVMDMEEESSREIEFSLDDEPETEEVEMNLSTADISPDETTPAEAAGEIDLGEIEEPPQQEEDDFTIDLGEEEPAEQAGEEPKFDFAEIDISDLAPAEKETDNLSVAEVIVAEEAPAAPSARTRSAALEDLQFKGIDLETQAISAQDAVTAGKISSSIKTGTALDNFDVDLGDLFADEKE
ncbi:hypothetical protein MNBD_DELTA04-1042 [hydrothermal vent metagenome]|uniref:Uncharacterized protein n=1 Tax=hydrothermal vent metagenome TaxID=652676 RepID=A0A3B0VD78_9ZZZZ